MDVDLEQLAELLAGQLQMQGDEGAVAVERPEVLDELSIDGIVTHLKKIMVSEDKRKVIVMTGAGLSTAAGIPDFRSPGTGLYHNLQKYNLPSPQAVFEIGYFRQNPKPFFELAKELYPALFKPTLSHYFIRLLAEKGLLLRNFTQNIDTLERRAGIHEDFLVEAHGAFHTAHCIDCGLEHQHEYVRDEVFAGGVPMCKRPGCARVPQAEGEPYHGLVKPDIVFFGEALPDRFAKCAVEDTKKCELLVVIGTSLVVHPFASLVDRVPDTCPRLLINLERVGEGNPLMKLLGVHGGLDFSASTGYRDVFLQKTCDEGCLQLAQMLGWEDELKELFAQQHKQLEKEIEAMKEELVSAKKAESEEKGREKEEDRRPKEEGGKEEKKDLKDEEKGREEKGREKEEDRRPKEEGGKEEKDLKEEEKGREENGREKEEDRRQKEEGGKEEKKDLKEEAKGMGENGREKEEDRRQKEEGGKEEKNLKEEGKGSSGEVRSNPPVACQREGDK